MELDVRDFAWWERKARIENARKKIVALGTTRLAMHGEESYERQIRDLVDQIELWDRPKWTDEEVIENWDDQIAKLQRAMAKMKK